VSSPARPTHAVAAVDLGASSGRVVLGLLGPTDPALSAGAGAGAALLEARLYHRFANRTTEVDGRLSWDIERLWQSILHGLADAARAARAVGLPLAGIGIDSWAVDYGLLDGDGTLLAPPVHYRDPRGARGRRLVETRLTPDALYARTGVQQLDLDTVYQLAGERPKLLERAATLLLVPDLLVHRLTGVVAAERTNASTTGLYDPRTGTWAPDVLFALGLDADLLPAVVDPGTPAGHLTTAARAAIAAGDADVEDDLAATTVFEVASHDTASAVAAVPATGPRFAYICTGTWSLVGVELDGPVTTRAAREAKLTNETGIDHTIRFLRNVAGLWPLQECLREWTAADGTAPDLPVLLAAAAERPVPENLPDLDASELAAPGDMPARLAAACAEAGTPVPADRPGLVAVIIAALARAQATALRDVLTVSGHGVDTVHLVGGGARNPLLVAATARELGLPVHAGPAEASALGNIGVQARGLGLVADRWELRRLVGAAGELS
jgi:rhamnulokinase